MKPPTAAAQVIFQALDPEDYAAVKQRLLRPRKGSAGGLNFRPNGRDYRVFKGRTYLGQVKDILPVFADLENPPTAGTPLPNMPAATPPPIAAAVPSNAGPTPAGTSTAPNKAALAPASPAVITNPVRALVPGLVTSGTKVAAPVPPLPPSTPAQPAEVTTTPENDVTANAAGHKSTAVVPISGTNVEKVMTSPVSTTGPVKAGAKEAGGSSPAEKVMTLPKPAAADAPKLAPWPSLANQTSTGTPSGHDLDSNNPFAKHEAAARALREGMISPVLLKSILGQ